MLLEQKSAILKAPCAPVCHESIPVGRWGRAFARRDFTVVMCGLVPAPLACGHVWTWTVETFHFLPIEVVIGYSIRFVPSYAAFRVAMVKVAVRFRARLFRDGA